MSKNRPRKAAVAAAPEVISAAVVTAAFGSLDSIGKYASSAAVHLQSAGARVAISGTPDLREFGTPFRADEGDGEPSVLLDFRDPIHWQRQGGRRLVGFISTEASIAPASWEIPLRRADAVVVPSRWVAETVAPYARAIVAPPPVDPAFAFRPKSRGPIFRVLFCVKPGQEYRKGWDLARAAFLAAFPNEDDVELVARSPFAVDLTTGERRIQLDVGRRALPAMAHLYQTADVLLYPSRAQVFGSTALEAMACGTPVIHTGQTGMRSFAEHGLPVAHRPIPGLNGDGEWREPYMDALVSRLRQAYEHPQAMAASDAAWVRSKFTSEAFLSALLPVL